jgi:monoamine oxidase
MMVPRKNPLIDYAKEVGFNIYEDLGKQKYFVGDREASKDELADLSITYKAFNKKIKESVYSGAVGEDDNARTALGEDFFKRPWGYTVASDYGVWNMAQNSEDWSPNDWWNSIGGDDWFCAEGYGSVVAHYGQDVPVALGTAVREIGWHSDGVKVVTSVGTINAKAAILTVSVGVLAANHIKFTPQLPVEKQEAIDGIDMAIMNYIGLHFSDDVFNFGSDTYVYQQQADENGVGYLANLNNTNLVYGYVGGDQARALEKEPMDTAIAYGLDGMKSLLGNDIQKKFIKGFATACGQIPLYEGAYSTAKPGKQPMRAVLRATLASKLFFSGEATHRVQWGSVNGGLYSGRDSANQAVAYVKENS